MTEPVSPLATFYKPGWEPYQHALVQTIALLSSEQLALSSGAQQRSIGEILEHMLGARFNWFHLWMGEGDPARDWNEDEDSAEPPVYKAAALVALFEKSWQVISSALNRWTCADLEQVFPPPASHQAWLRKQGLKEEPAHTRQWIVWHVMEHEIHHGGELSLALGTHGLESFYTS
ncbi:MAG TPA: DinB family protein [Ktedonobacteraceae bacterium]